MNADGKISFHLRSSAFVPRLKWRLTIQSGDFMLKTKNTLDLKIRKTVTGLLQDRLVDAIDLQTQMKQAHWNIKGPHFIGLHKLFDEINEDVEEYIDEIAERAVQLGAIVHGTARAVAKNSSLKEYPLDI